jgi:hypothetical protein
MTGVNAVAIGLLDPGDRFGLRNRHPRARGSSPRGPTVADAVTAAAGEVVARRIARHTQLPGEPDPIAQENLLGRAR